MYISEIMPRYSKRKRQSRAASNKHFQKEEEYTTINNNNNVGRPKIPFSELKNQRILLNQIIQYLKSLVFEEELELVMMELCKRYIPNIYEKFQIGNIYFNNMTQIFEEYGNFFKKQKIGGDIATIATTNLPSNIITPITKYSKKYIKKLKLNKGNLYNTYNFLSKKF